MLEKQELEDWESIFNEDAYFGKIWFYWVVSFRVKLFVPLAELGF